MYDEYKINNRAVVEVWEGDVVAKFIQDNDMSFTSTYDGGSDDKTGGSPQIQNCSLYMERK